MEPSPSAPLPGSMTVSPLFQWETVGLVVAVAVVVALVAAVLLVAGLGRDRRAEWEEWLASRSGAREDAADRP
ncbi:hypothetical protein [Blastococcus atacamensis]|uniref:hypothetical protein n=1 Tax=Blastococcus atacamensis TaxID=2070508 RepID=UPI0012FFF9F3|nr:hypothetical protein [Blastococcus atacamensis]